MSDGLELALALYPDDWVAITTAKENDGGDPEFHTVFLRREVLNKIVLEMEEINGPQ